VVSSIRSRHTGQVGSSTNAGVGGAIGLVVSALLMAGSVLGTAIPTGVGCAAGKNGSLVMLGKLVGFSAWSET
jgi:hypothetical protein